jgi:GR25 family glycosyltransferase involved in LPS biosynthesis
MLLDVTQFPAYVINLDTRPDRWKRFTRIDTGLPNLQRFSAINGIQIGDVIDNADISDFTKLRILSRTRRSHEEIDAEGAIGCTLSHVNLWQQFLASNHTHLIVNEDDLNLEPFKQPGSFAQYLQSQINSLPSDGWDVWLAGYNVLRDCSPWNQPQATPKITGAILEPNIRCHTNAEYLDIRSFFGTHCYIVTREGAQKLLDRVFPIESHVDAYIGLQAQLGRIRIVANGVQFHLTNSRCETDIQHGQYLMCQLGYRDGIYKILTYLLIILLIIVIIAFIVQIRYGKSVFLLLREQLHCGLSNSGCKGAQICTVT